MLAIQGIQTGGYGCQGLQRGRTPARPQIDQRSAGKPAQLGKPLDVPRGAEPGEHVVDAEVVSHGHGISNIFSRRKGQSNIVASAALVCGSYGLRMTSASETIRRIERIMKVREINPSSLATASGLSAGTLRMMFKRHREGKNPAPSYGAIIGVSRVTNIPPWTLLIESDLPLEVMLSRDNDKAKAMLQEMPQEALLALLLDRMSDDSKTTNSNLEQILSTLQEHLRTVQHATARIDDLAATMEVDARGRRGTPHEMAKKPRT